MKRLATVKMIHISPHAQTNPIRTWAICAQSWPGSPP